MLRQLLEKRSPSIYATFRQLEEETRSFSQPNCTSKKRVKKLCEDLKRAGFLQDFDAYAAQIAAIRADYNTWPTCVCGNRVNMFNGIFRTFCSRKCSSISKETKQKSVATSLRRFGTTHPSQHDSVKKKQTASLSATHPELQRKRLATIQERYGSTHALGKIVFSKAADTLFSKHGVRNISQLPDSPSHQAARLIYQKKLSEEILPALAAEGYTALWEAADYHKLTPGSYLWKHSCGNEFVSHFNYAGIKPICQKCFPRPVSKPQELLHAMFPEAVRNTRKIIKPLELDLFFEEQKVAVEVNGWYWHQEKLGRSTLLEKTKKCQEMGIRLLHFWDFEILEKPNIVQSMISSAIGSTQKVGARKLQLVDISSKHFSEFCNSNHISGSAASSVRMALLDDRTPIAVAGFCKSRFAKDADFELVRYCSKNGITVVGGLSRLISCFTRNHPGRLVSFSDNRFYTGESYRSIGFDFIIETPPGYIWRKGNTTLTRQATQKHKLSKLLPVFYPDKSESENMVANGWAKLVNCGHRKWIYKV